MLFEHPDYCKSNFLSFLQPVPTSSPEPAFCVCLPIHRIFQACPYDPKWYANALRFETEAEADRYGLDLILRWTGSRDYRAATSDDDVNYKFTDDGLERVTE